MKLLKATPLGDKKYQVEFDVGTFELRVGQYDTSLIIGIEGQPAFYVALNDLTPAASKRRQDAHEIHKIAYDNGLCFFYAVKYPTDPRRRTIWEHLNESDPP